MTQPLEVAVRVVFARVGCARRKKRSKKREASGERLKAHVEKVKESERNSCRFYGCSASFWPFLYKDDEEKIRNK